MGNAVPELVEIDLLGGVAVRGRGNPGSSRAIGLLAYLVLNAGRSQSRSHLAGVFWPDSSEAQARTNLRRELHALRAILVETGLTGDGPLLVEATTLCWRDVDACRVDVRCFAVARGQALTAERAGDVDELLRHAAGAVEWYRGALLPGWYDDWVLAAREDLEQQCVQLCDLVVASTAARTHPAEVLALARRRVQLSPLEEPGYAQLMALQAALGDRAGAMTTYHRCASVLEQELGVGPSGETVRAMEAIIGAPDRVPSTVGAKSGDRRRVDRPALTGRAAELAALGARWEAAISGRPGLVLVSGEAGVGKSRLVTEFAQRVARRGAVVAAARCFGASGRLALAPVADWLRSPPLRAALPALESVWREEVQRLLPQTGQPADHFDASRAKVDAWQRLRFFEGLARAVLVAGRPTLLVLDDLQWCDNDTILWISFLVELAADAPLLLVLTARDDELSENLGVLAALRPLRSSGRVAEIALGPFSVVETADVAARMLDVRLSDDDLLLLQSATGGYPLYVVEAIRSIAAGAGGVAVAADDVSAVLRQRLADASESAREVAGLAAAVGRDFGLVLLSEASDLEADAVVGAVDELWRRRILRQSDQGYDFSHDLVRDAAYTAVQPARRWLHHRRLAEAIERLNRDRLDAVAGQLASHHARSGRPDLALPYYARAADAALKVYASAEAIRLLRLRLDLVMAMPTGEERDRLELTTLQAISAPLNARHGYAAPELEDVLTRSIELAESLGETTVLLGSTVALWAARFVRGDIAGSLPVGQRALALSERVPELAGQAHFAVGGSALSLGDLEVAVGHLDLARELSVGAVSLTVGTRPEVHAQAWVAHARWLLGDPAGAERDARESVARARAAQHPYSLAVALAYAAITHQMAADLPALDADLAELTDLCDRYDLAYYREWGLVLSGWREGGAAGVDRMRVGLANLAAEHAFARLPYWLCLLAETHIGCGDDVAARAALDAARVAGVQHDDSWWLPEVLRWSATLQAPDAARQTLGQAIALASRQSSAALLQRCHEDLASLGVRASANGVR